MPNKKESLLQEHICQYLHKKHEFLPLSASDLKDAQDHILETHLFQFIKTTQSEKYAEIEENFGSDTNAEILKALKQEVARKPLWLLMRQGLTVRGAQLALFKPKPRSGISAAQQAHYEANIFAFKKEYAYHPNTKERIDLVIWLNGLPVIILELKHGDGGQNCDDAIFESFLPRDLKNSIYKFPFLYIAASESEVKVATDPRSEKNFRWFNAQLINQAETEGEYPIEYLYRDALSKESIAKYLEHYLVFSPATESTNEAGALVLEPAFTIFPRFHQFRASRGVADSVLEHREVTGQLGKKFLINHSAGSGKTLTIAWMADRLDSLYTSKNEKVFDQIVILTDRVSLDKNVKDDLEKFSHLRSKLNFSNRSADLASFLDKDRDIIVSTIHKFGHIQEKLKASAALKNRKIAFLIDEAHRSQEGKMALNLRQYFTKDGEVYEQEADETSETDNIADQLEKLDISNQIFVAFTATATAKTVSYFGEPFDVYSEEEAIKEGYILDVAQNIISYETLYHLKIKETVPDKDFPAGLLSKLLRNIAYNDDDIIQYKSEVIVNLFEEKVNHTIGGKGKAMVVTSSRPAGLKYFNHLKTIMEEKGLPYKILYAFSDYTDPVTHENIEEVKVNELDSLHGGKIIEEVFDLPEYRILVVANKFQTGFDQPLLAAMFLDKVVNGVNAIQTVSRLNRKRKEKEQSDILVVDFTNNAANIFEAFNRHRKGTPHKATEPKKEGLEKVFKEIQKIGVFNSSQITEYVDAYLDTQNDIEDATASAKFDNLKQAYLNIFKQKLPKIEYQKNYVSLLRRYAKLYYFVAKFFSLEAHLHEFNVFAESMADKLSNRGKTSELSQLLKNVELKKGAVKYRGLKSNIHVVKEPNKTGIRTGSNQNSSPRATIEEAIRVIEEKYQISKADAIVIKAICEEVSNHYDIKRRITANKDNLNYLKTTATPKVRKEVINGYRKRDMWKQLEDPIYVERGGIISLMGKAIIERVLGVAG